jgi:hypothetical protein
MTEVLQFKSAKSLSDESLSRVLTELAEYAQRGKISRMVCVCVEDDQRLFKIIHHAADLSLVGALSIVMDDLKASCWRNGSCTPKE